MTKPIMRLYQISLVYYIHGPAEIRKRGQENAESPPSKEHWEAEELSPLSSSGQTVTFSKDEPVIDKSDWPSIAPNRQKAAASVAAAVQFAERLARKGNGTGQLETIIARHVVFPSWKRFYPDLVDDQRVRV